MATPINIPKLGMAMTEGELASWIAADGSTVEAGDIIYTVATDKVENDVEAPVSGTLRHIGIEGETYAVGETIGEIE
ncbi:dihydrolipoamide acyltransferase [Mycobacterium sp. OAE908]|uniref:biotin/lipoyl-containing protein n=1 Tax=Mycobacterium sp. OAE908 TaxID=2817899 RepID=UPI001AEA342D